MTASAIEWTERSDWNPVRGCTRASEGCRNCYAEQIAGRFSGPEQPFNGFATRTSEGGRWTGKVEVQWDRLTLPLTWRRPATIFANSTSDLFHERLATDDIAAIYAVAVAAHHLRGHVTQILTKRPGRARELLSSFDFWDQVNALAGMHVMEGVDPLNRRSDDARATLDDYDPHNPAPGVWLGTSIEDRAALLQRAGDLRQTPAARHFFSCEPLIGDLGDVLLDGIDWVIVGGESGRGARPMHPDWARKLRDQCTAAGVPFFFKQWGEWAPVSDIDLDALDSQLYHPAPARDPEATRRCKVAQCVLHRDGLRFADGEWEKTDGARRILAFQAGHGAMTMMRIGKARAGRALDGVQHDAVPA